MATASVERERKRVRNRARMAEARPANDVAPTVTRQKRAEPERKVGLRWMLGKGKITRAMCEAGERYGLGVRVASCVDAAAVKSCLAALEGGGGGGGAMFRSRSPEDLEAAEWVAEYKRQTIFLRSRFFEDVELTAVLDSICIRQLTPREIIEGNHSGGREVQLTSGQVQRHAETLEAVAYTVLKLLIGHLRDYDNLSHVPAPNLSCAA